jgi:hypothetical protein
MEQLTLAHIFQFAKELQGSGMTLREICNLPIYLGDDDELNGIHTAWFANTISESNPDDEGFIELIGEDHCNVEFKGKAILIS